MSMLRSSYDEPDINKKYDASLGCSSFVELHDWLNLRGLTHAFEEMLKAGLSLAVVEGTSCQNHIKNWSA